MIKLLKNWFYQKIINKKCAPKLVFFIAEEIEKIRMIFDIKKWLWKSNFGTIWKLAINPKLKIQWFSYGMLILRQKSFKFCTPRSKTPQPLLPFCRPKNFSPFTVKKLLRNPKVIDKQTAMLGHVFFPDFFT